MSGVGAAVKAVALERLRNARLHAANMNELRAVSKTPAPTFAGTVDDVRTVQAFAGELGATLDVDGVPGSLTTRFLRMFQSTYAVGDYRTTPLAVTGSANVATMKAIAHCRSNGLKVTDNFSYREYASKNPSKVVTAKNPVIMLERDLVLGMQSLREYYGAPISIVSGFRDSYWNTLIGGARSSQHMLGKAADFRVHGPMPTETVCARWFNGIGRHSLSGRVSHVDTRPHYARWFYSGS